MVKRLSKSIEEQKYNVELSYKQVCKKLKDKEVNGGKNRDLQLNRWNNYYEVKKIGRGKYIIYRQLSKEESQDKLDGENYSKYLQHMLLKMIAESKDIKTVYTYRQIREHLFMVNSHYFPTRYGQEDIEIKIPYGFEEGYSFDFQDKWFNIADAHDKSVIQYALNKLKENDLICSCENTYIFYRRKMVNENSYIVEHRQATDKELADIAQIKLDFIKSKGKTNFKDIYLMGSKILKEYYKNIFDYIHGLGYSRYAKAVIITRPTELKKVVNYFAPKFNRMQVERYLESKRFKVIPPFIHEQLTGELIKSNALRITAEELGQK